MEAFIHSWYRLFMYTKESLETQLLNLWWDYSHDNFCSSFLINFVFYFPIWVQKASWFWVQDQHGFEFQSQALAKIAILHENPQFSINHFGKITKCRKPSLFSTPMNYVALFKSAFKWSQVQDHSVDLIG